MPLQFLVYKTHAVANRWRDDGSTTSDPIVIPDEYHSKPVTEISSGCFSGNTSIEHIVLPKTLKRIGSHAFEGCSNLKKVNTDPEAEFNILPETMETIEERAFSRSGIAGTLVISGKHLTIGADAFEKCSGLTRVCFACKELILDSGAFRSCYFLESVLGPTKVETIPQECFAYCYNLKIVTLPFRVAEDRCFFENVQLHTIKPLHKLKSSGKDAFCGCHLLENIPDKWKGKKPMNLDESETGEAKASPEPEAENSTGNDCRNESEKSLLKLPMENDNMPPFHFSDRLKGFFRGESGTKFKVTLPATMAVTEYDVVPITDLAGILAYLAERNIAVYLYGKYTNGFYQVHDIEPDVKLGPLANTSFFREVLRRIRKSPVPSEADNAEPYHLRTPDEFQCFFDMCRETLPPWVQKAVQKELLATSKVTPSLTERNPSAQLALEILLNVDWNPPRNLYIPTLREAQETLDKEFSGLQSVKREFLGLIAQMERTGKLPQENLLLVGPPGVGKTYLINTMARILKLPVVQIDFSGIEKGKDEITGSNRIYSNSCPGTFLQGCYDHRTSTVLLFLNEVDKASEQNASDTLLQLLDGAGVKENFLEQVIPTKGRVLCIGSANDVSKLSAPLRNRFREVSLEPYTYQEKLQIWRKHALPAALEYANVSPEEFRFTDEAEETLIKEYGTEPGVRDIYTYARDFVRDYCYAAATDPNTNGHTYTPEEIRQKLGPSPLIHRPFNVRPGSVRFGYLFQGRAVLSMVEVSVEKGTGKLDVLGVVPQIQKQYARIAWKAVKKTTSYDLSNLDVTVFFTTPVLSCTPDNIVGLPVYLGLCSALIRMPLNLADTVIYGGGIDLFGNIYLDCTSPVTSLIHTMEDAGLRVIYGPTGLSSRVHFAQCENSPIILEAHDGEALARMVMANNQNSAG